MDIDHNTYESFKTFLGILGSAFISFMAWIYKRRVTRLASIDNSIANLSQHSNIVDVEIRELKTDVAEIKADLKKILFKL